MKRHTCRSERNSIDLGHWKYALESRCVLKNRLINRNRWTENGKKGRRLKKHCIGIAGDIVDVGGDESPLLYRFAKTVTANYARTHPWCSAQNDTVGIVHRCDVDSLRRLLYVFHLINCRSDDIFVQVSAIVKMKNEHSLPKDFWYQGIE